MGYPGARRDSPVPASLGPEQGWQAWGVQLVVGPGMGSTWQEGSRGSGFRAQLSFLHPLTLVRGILSPYPPPQPRVIASVAGDP